MCADLNQNQPPAPGSPQPEGKAEKVQSGRYDWDHDIAAAYSPGRPKPRQVLKRSRSFWASLRSFFRTLFDSDRNPFDRDDDADPMAA